MLQEYLTLYIAFCFIRGFT